MYFEKRFGNDLDQNFVFKKRGCLFKVIAVLMGFNFSTLHSRSRFIDHNNT